MLLADAILRIVTDITDLKSGLQKATQQITQFKSFVNKGLAGIGAGISVAWFESFITQSMESADQMYNLTKRTGMTAEQLSVLKEAAEKSGSSIESFSAIIRRLPNLLNRAASGSNALTEAMKKAGIDPKQAAQDYEYYLKKVGEFLRKMTTEGPNRAGWANTFLGRGGEAFAQTLVDYDEAAKRMARLHTQITTQQALAGEKFHNAMKDFSSMASSIGREIGTPIATALSDIAEGFTRLERSAKIWTTIGELIATGLRAVAAAIIYLGYGIDLLSKALSTLNMERFNSWVDKLDQLSKMDFAQATNKLRELVNVAERWEEIKRNPTSLLTVGVSGIPLRLLQGAKDKVEPVIGRHDYVGPDDYSKRPPGGAGNPPTNEEQAKAEAFHKAMLAMYAQQRKGALEMSRLQAQEQLSVLQYYQQRNLVSTREFFAYKNEIEQQQYEDERAALLANQAELEAEMKRAEGKHGKRSAEYVRAETQMLEVQQQQALLWARRKGQVEDNARAEQLALHALTNEFASMYLEMQKVAGVDLTGLSDFQIDLKYEKILEEAMKTSDEIRKQVELFIKMQKEMARINAYAEEMAKIQQRTSNAEERIMARVREGKVNELESLRDRSLLRFKMIEELEGKLKKAEAEAAASPANKDMQDRVDEMRTRLATLRADADLVAQTFREIGEGPLATFFNDILNGTASVQDAFKSMCKAILAEMNNLIAKDLAKQLMASLFPTGTASQGSNFWSAGLKTILGGIGGWLGGGAGAAVGGAAGGGMAAGSAYALTAADLLGMGAANGGQIFAGRPVMVGERGPEVIVPSHDASVISNERITKIFEKVKMIEPRALGGPVRRGMNYLVGERGVEMMVVGANGPEVFRAPKSGTIIPSNKTAQYIKEIKTIGSRAPDIGRISAGSSLAKVPNLARVRERNLTSGAITNMRSVIRGGDTITKISRGSGGIERLIRERSTLMQSAAGQRRSDGGRVESPVLRVIRNIASKSAAAQNSAPPSVSGGGDQSSSKLVTDGGMMNTLHSLIGSGGAIPGFRSILGGGGLISGLASSGITKGGVASTFSSGGGGVFGGGLLGLKSTAENVLSSLPRREMGGNVLSNSDYIVGERGPEIYRAGASRMPTQSSSRTQQIQNVTMIVNAKDAKSFVAAESQVQAAAARAVRKGQRNL